MAQDENIATMKRQRRNNRRRKNPSQIPNASQSAGAGPSHIPLASLSQNQQLPQHSSFIPFPTIPDSIGKLSHIYKYSVY